MKFTSLSKIVCTFMLLSVVMSLSAFEGCFKGCTNTRAIFEGPGNHVRITCTKECMGMINDVQPEHCVDTCIQACDPCKCCKVECGCGSSMFMLQVDCKSACAVEF